MKNLSNSALGQLGLQLASAVVMITTVIASAYLFADVDALAVANQSLNMFSDFSLTQNN